MVLEKIQKCRFEEQEDVWKLTNPKETFTVTEGQLKQLEREYFPKKWLRYARKKRGSDRLRVPKPYKKFLSLCKMFWNVQKLFTMLWNKEISKDVMNALTILNKQNRIEQSEYIGELLEQDIVTKCRSTQYNFLKEIKKSGLVKVKKSKPSSRGRPPKVWRIDKKQTREILQFPYYEIFSSYDCLKKDSLDSDELEFEIPNRRILRFEKIRLNEFSQSLAKSIPSNYL